MSIQKDLEKVKEVFLSKDLDQEDYDENLEQINSWEQGLRENEDLKDWQDSEITKSIILQARTTYKELALNLMNNRKLTEEERKSIYSRQDAMLWLLSLVYKDVKSNIGAIHREIQQAIKVVDN